MPCYDPRDHEPRATQEEINRERRHNSPEAEMLCAVMKTVNPLYYSEEIQKWWSEHQERDKIRNPQEAAQ